MHILKKVLFTCLSLWLARQVIIAQPFTDIATSLPSMYLGNVTWGDYDNDGQMDILLTGWFGAPGWACKVFHNDGNGAFHEINANLSAISSGYATWVDYNSDGFLDIFLSGSTSGNGTFVKIYRNQGGSSFVDAQASIPSPCCYSSAFLEFATWGDFDNDGDPDLLTQAGLICRNDGDGHFTDISAGLPLLLDSSGDWGDFDNDGDLDILVTGTDFRGVCAKIFRNDGDGVFTEVAAHLPGVRYGMAIWGDYDNDRRLDVFLKGWTNVNDSTIFSKVFHNDGAGNFSDAGFVLPPIDGPAKWVDYNHDGFLDLFLVNINLNAVLYQNLNGTSLNDSGISFSAYRPGAADWLDYDGDGDLDLFLSATTNGIATIERNDSPLPSISVPTPTGLSATVLGNQVSLSWNAPSNATNNVTHNLRVGRTPDGVDVISPLSDPKTGVRRLQCPGNVQHNLNWRIRHLTPGTYFWSVQSIDSTFRGSSFAPKGMFVIPNAALRPEVVTDPATQVTRFDARLNGVVYPNRSETTVFFQFGTDTNYGAIFTAGTFLGDIVATNVSVPTSNLVQGTVYHYRVLATNTIGVAYGLDRTFRTENYSPTLSSITNMQFPASVLTISTNLVIGDSESPAEQLVLTGRSSNTNLVRNEDIVFSGSGSNRTVTITRQSNQIGSASIIITVMDPQGGNSSGSFVVNIAFFTFATSLRFSGLAAWGDYDNDGLLDVLKSDSIWRNIGNQTFSNKISLSLFGYCIAWGDYDNDGDLDVFAGAVGSRLFRNNTNGTFSTNQIAGLTIALYGSAAWGDFDNDGRLDLLLTGSTNSSSAGRNMTRIYRNNGNQTFTNALPGLPGVELSSVDWGDYDNDGRLDFIVSGGTFGLLRNITRIYHNNGDGTFTDIQAGLPGLMLSSVAWGDYDNDGYLDVLISGNTGDYGSYTGLARIYRNNRDGTFTDIGANLPRILSSSVAWGDFNNDGYLDILMAGRTNESKILTRVYVNKGNGTFTDLEANLPSIFSGSAAWGDYDNDGKLDILLSWDGITSVHRNNSLVSNSPPSAPSNLQAKLLAHNNVILAWDPATDNETTNSTGLYYNLRLGTTPGGMQLFSPQSDLATGLRRVPNFGNAGHTNQWLVANLPRGTYYWSVQAIDTGLAGSPFSSEASFTITNDVDFASNHPPVAYGQDLSVTEDSQISITLSASDPDNDVLSYSILKLPSHGTLRGIPPNLTYTPATNYFGPDGFDFRVRDGLTNSSVARIAITVTPVQDSQGLKLTYDFYPGSFVVWISGEPYQGYRLEVSTNLIDWQSDYAFTNSNFVYGFGYSTAGSARKFFRVRVLP